MAIVEEDTSRNAILDALWSRVLDHWDDERPHAALLDHAIRVHALPEIAGRYRALAGDDAKGTLAKKKLDVIVAAATQMLWATKMPAPGKVPWPITLSAVGISAVLLSWLAWALWGHHG